ncbi:tyrosine-type recombinase/integrase [Azospirillum sp. TSH64]|uniref:tyrosine-type recombinase/integrase n=1 Tax=Azospirillum sp. TSH64 TaxID=652740 RepID=UPI000D64315B|nr:tyrosine-type recombinase/integrase [Azospirillum sp. TSH64]
MGDLTRMPNGVAPVGLAAALPLDRIQEGLIDAFLASRKANTVAAYRRDLEDFRAWVAAQPATAAYADTIDRVARELLALAPGQANALVLGYRASLDARGLAPATINRRLAALRSLVQLGKTLGLVGWDLEVENVDAAAYRDTRGPGRDGVKAMIAQAQERSDAKGVRDTAIVRLLHDTALRRGEVVSLDLEHYDPAAATLSILGKGRLQREPITLPDATQAALDEWIGARGRHPGPLFYRLDNAGAGDGRLTGAAVYQIVQRLGDDIGIRTRPHGLRHAAITSALDATNGNLRAAQSFARHRDPKVTMRYDDNRADLAGQTARLVAEE